jgi:hypothetical protein
MFYSIHGEYSIETMMDTSELTFAKLTAGAKALDTPGRHGRY